MSDVTPGARQARRRRTPVRTRMVGVVVGCSALALPACAAPAPSSVAGEEAAAPALVQAGDGPATTTTTPSTTVAPTTVPSTTVAPTTVAPTTVPSTTVPSTTVVPTTVPSTTVPVAAVAPTEPLVAASGVTVRTEASSAAQAGAPSLVVNPRTGLNPDGQTLAVGGTGFSPAKNGGVGVYVVFGPRNGEFWLDANLFLAAKWVHVGASPSPGQAELNPDGSFLVNLDVKAQYTDGNGTEVDCRVVGCHVMTFAAHGAADRTQDLSVPVTFAGAGGPTTTTPPTSGGSGGSTTSGSGASVAGSTTSSGSTSGSTSGGSPSSGSSRPGSTSGRANPSVLAATTQGSLARTGSEPRTPLLIALVLLAAGAGALVAGRAARPGRESSAGS